MALADLLTVSQSRKKIGLSEERIEAIKPALREYIAFWREYPDLFIDFLQDGGNPEVEKKLMFCCNVCCTLIEWFVFFVL